MPSGATLNRAGYRSASRYAGDVAFPLGPTPILGPIRSAVLSNARSYPILGGVLILGAGRHDQVMRKTRLIWAAGLVALVSGCVPSHVMQRRLDDGSCPARYLAPESANQPTSANQPASANQAPAGVRNALTWSGPADTRDIEKNNAWCRTVEPPILLRLPRLPPGVRPEDRTRVDSVAIVTWNINVGGGDVVAFLAEELNVTCDGTQPSDLRPPFHFVMLLQEVYRSSSRLPEARSGPNIPLRIEPNPPPGGRLEILEVAERCGLALFYVPSARNGPDEPGRLPEDKGNAILSTLPLADLAAIELPFEAGRKVAVVATIPGPNGERIRVVSVHLDVASTLTRTLISGNATRLRQALGLAVALEAMDSLATVVGGDFNTWSADESTLKRLAVHFPDSPPWDGLPTRGPFPPDHILFRTVRESRIDLVEDSYRRFEETYGSDHAGRIVWLRGQDTRPFGHANELRQRPGFHLLHDPATMDLDGLFADVEFPGDHLVEPTGDHVRHDLVLP